VKKKGGREMNPMDSHRKAERARQLARNKKERQMQREAMSLVDDPAVLRTQLKEILDEEELGPLNVTQRSRKKTLQRAYDAAIRRQMVWGILVWMFVVCLVQPNLTYTYSTSLLQELEAKKKEQKSQENAPLEVSAIPLPPLPPGGMPPLPPSGGGGGGMPPPGMRLAPPRRPPPIINSQENKQGSSGPAVQSQAPVITAKSTVVPLPKAHLDKKLTSLVPASVQASRPSVQKKTHPGLVPRTVVRTSPTTTGGKSQPPPDTSTDVPDNFDDFMNSLRNM
jgi:hypothetical protein